MTSSASRFILAILTAMAWNFCALHAEALGKTEGAFVRGMMAADHQFGLYMTESDASPNKSSQVVNSRGSSSSSQEGMRRRGGSSDPFPLNAVDKAMDVAVDFANTVRRRAFSRPGFVEKSR